MPRLPICSLALLGLLLAACGESGSRATHPVEVLIQVSGIQGTAFTVSGLSAANAAHDLAAAMTCISDDPGKRQSCRSDADCPGSTCAPTFVTPRLFVLENAYQPVRGTFRNIDPRNPVRIDLVAGTFSHSGDLQSGQYCVIGTDVACIPTDPCVLSLPASEPGALPTPTPCQPTPTPVRSSGQEVRFEVYSVDSTTSLAFTASLGDLTATNLTSCAISPIAGSCQTPTTFFVEDAEGTASGIFTKIAYQNRDVAMQVDLYIDGTLVDSERTKSSDDSDDRTVVVSHDL